MIKKARLLQTIDANQSWFSVGEVATSVIVAYFVFSYISALTDKSEAPGMTEEGMLVSLSLLGSFFHCHNLCVEITDAYELIGPYCTLLVIRYVVDELLLKLSWIH